MNSIGLDLHKRYSQICVLSSEGEVTEFRIRTAPEVLRDRFTTFTRSRILVESSTESEWVARVLEELGHEVIVADPNFAPMYATRSRSVKTDRRDALALAQACRLGAYKSAHRLSDSSVRLRARLRVRRALVQTRTRFINQIRALVRQQGLRIAPGASNRFLLRLSDVPLPSWLQEDLEPLCNALGIVEIQMEAVTEELKRIAAADPTMQRLMTVPGVGPITAATFVSTIDQVERFRSAREVRSYLGLVPRESSSGERLRRGRVTKAGNPWARTALIEAAWISMRRGELRSWAQQIAQRRGRSKAAVALARKLAGILFAIWRDESIYQSQAVQTSAA